MNKFDEAINLMEKIAGPNELEVWFEKSDFIDMIENLREEYAPTVEMTKDRKDNLIYMKKEGYSFLETIADIDSGVLIREFDSYWNPLTEEQLMRAWLDPNVIKVVEGEQ